MGLKGWAKFAGIARREVCGGAREPFIGKVARHRNAEGAKTGPIRCDGGTARVRAAFSVTFWIRKRGMKQLNPESPGGGAGQVAVDDGVTPNEMNFLKCGPILNVVGPDICIQGIIGRYRIRKLAVGLEIDSQAPVAVHRIMRNGVAYRSGAGDQHAVVRVEDNLISITDGCAADHIVHRVLEPNAVSAVIPDDIGLEMTA